MKFTSIEFYIFSKNVSSKERLESSFFVTFNIIISHIFPEYSIEILQDVQKLWRISLSVLAIFINFTDFLTLPCYKETNNVNLDQMMSAIFHFQHTLNIFFNNCIELYWYSISFSRNMKGRSIWPHQKKLPSKSPALFGLPKCSNEPGKS